MMRLLKDLFTRPRSIHGKTVQVIKPPAYRCIAVHFRYGAYEEFYLRKSNTSAEAKPLGRRHFVGSPDTWRPCADYDYTADTAVIDMRIVFERRPIVITCLPTIGNVPDGEPCELGERTGLGLRGAMARYLAKHPIVASRPVFHLPSGDPVSSLHIVSVTDYVAIVRPLGARIGRVENGEIVWEGEGQRS